MRSFKAVTVAMILAIGLVPSSRSKANPERLPSPQEVESLVSQARNGNAAAQFRLALAYETGHGTRQSYKDAVRWFKSAANQGLPDAQFHLGQIYEEGRGVKKDFAYALSWYEEAARNGLKLAVDHLQTLTGE